MNERTVNLLIGGEAGQGLVSLGRILAESIVRSGYSIVVTQSYQSRIRGGHNTFAVLVGEEEVLAPQESVDLLVALNGETVDLHRGELSRDGLIIADESLGFSGDRFVCLPFDQLGSKKAANMAALGAAGSLLGLGEELVARAAEELFGKAERAEIAANRGALAGAYRWMSEHPVDFSGPAPVSSPPKRLMLNGNEAIALGALSAGVKFCSFYPMTPATTIPLNLAAFAERMGIIVEQTEDEISAINMALGASFAGAPSIVATSGGGFALMTEGVSLAAMTETPVVIVVAQRPGPATGLPTRTEQGDLEFVLHAGHGEFPRAIFAPGTVEECFHLTRKAFELAHRFNGPIFLLTDQFLADSYRATAPFDLENLSPIDTCPIPGAHTTPFRTYSITETGVSPRLLPGLTEQCVVAESAEHLVVSDSDEHGEDGALTEDLGIRKRMVEKRLRKLDALRSEVVPPEISGDPSPQVLMVSWGSTRGPALRAAKSLRNEGRSVGTLHFPQVWPLIPDHFVERLEQAEQTVCIESNATGQFARLIRRETGFNVDKRVLRYDGLPITPEYILRRLT